MVPWTAATPPLQCKESKSPVVAGAMVKLKKVSPCVVRVSPSCRCVCCTSFLQPDLHRGGPARMFARLCFVPPVAVSLPHPFLLWLCPLSHPFLLWLCPLSHPSDCCYGVEYVPLFGTGTETKWGQPQAVGQDSWCSTLAVLDLPGHVSTTRPSLWLCLHQALYYS